MKIRSVIIDDEQGSRETLEKMTSLYCPKIELMGQADGVQEGIKLIEKAKPELIFLDIKMHDGTGFDLLKKIPVDQFQVIFVTAYDEFALNAIKFSALDYLLKPIEPDDLMKAVEKAGLNKEKDLMSLKVKTLLHNIEKENKKLTVKTSESFHIISINEIVRCEAESNYTKFYLSDGTKILVSTTLKEYEDVLHSYQFFRIHQSHLINLNHVSRFDKKDGGMIVMKDKSQIPVSLRKKERLLELLESL